MRSILIAAVLAGCADPTPAESPGNAPGSERVYISIGADAVGMLPAHAQLLSVEPAGAIAELDTAEVDVLTERMHEQFHRCGGFMVHESLADAYAALAEPASPGPIDYRLDRQALVRAVMPKLDKARILATIGELQAMKNRYYRSESGAAMSTWVRDRWQSFTSRRDVTIELVDHGYPQKSVVLTIPGTTRASEVVVLGGHMDSIGRGGSSAVAPGADDDASGIATLTETLRVLLASDYRPARTIKFMAYAAEEVGLRGSLSIARDYQKRKIDVVGALQLDMTNYQGSDKDIWLIQDHTNPAQNKFVATLIDEYTGATRGEDQCGYACSDHAAWHRYGFRASMPFESRFAQYNRSIHTDRDTLERSNNNADHAIKFARLAAAYAIELGKGELAQGTGGNSDDDSHGGAYLALALLGLAAYTQRRLCR